MHVRMCVYACVCVCMQSVLDQTFKVEQLLVDSNFSSPDTLKDVQDILGQYSISAALFMCRGAPSVLPSQCVVVLYLVPVLVVQHHCLLPPCTDSLTLSVKVCRLVAAMERGDDKSEVCSVCLVCMCACVHVCMCARGHATVEVCLYMCLHELLLNWSLAC